jgi:Alcohol dehydrogenase GroES-like domain
MYEYHKPLVIEDVQRPTKELLGDKSLAKSWRSRSVSFRCTIDDRYFQKFMSPKLPLILGHEISGWIEELGPTVPHGLFEKGDLVVVYSG